MIRKALYAAIIVPIVLLFLAQAFSTPITGIVIPNKVTTGNTDDTHPVADSNEIQGGPMQFAYSSQLRTIPESRKRRGMLVYIAETDAYYQAYSTNGHYWKRWGGDAADVSGKLDVERYLDYSSQGRVSPTDPRLSDAREPTAHTQDIATVTGLQDALDGKQDTLGFTPVADTDPRLSDAREPTAHTQAISTVTGLTTALDAKVDDEEFRLYTSTRGAATQGEKGDRGYDGRHGNTITCTILDGTRSLVYSAAGELQTSSIEPLYAYAYVDGQLVTPVEYSWFIPPTASQLRYPAIQPDGMQAKLQYFAYRAYSSYDVARNNNYAAVQLTISSVRQPYGKRYCTASVPIAIIKEGDQGIPGPAASVTEPAVITAFAGTASNAALVLQTTSGNQIKFEITDEDQNTRLAFDSEGNQYLRDGSGNALVKVLADGSIWLFRPGNVARVKIMNDGTVTTYHSDGTTPAFSIYSTGWTKGPAGWPASNGVCKKFNTDGSEYFEACATGGSGTPGGTDKQFQYNNAGVFGGSTHLKETATGVEITGTLVVK